MSALRPSVAEERWLAVREMLGDDVVPAALTNGWRRATLLPRIAFFFLGSLCGGALYGLSQALLRHYDLSSCVTAMVCVGTAELLVIRKRSWGFGFEEALYLGGVMVAVHVFPWQHTTPYLAASAIGVAFVAVRLANPLFATVAAALTIGTIASAAEAPPSLIGGTAAAAAITWLLSAKHFASPRIQRTLEWLSVALPLFAYALSFLWPPAIPRWPALLAGVVIAAVLAIRLRQRALLYAAFACAAMLAWELRKLTPLSLEAKLIAYGAATLIAAVVAERSLRRTYGVTALPLGRDAEGWRLVELGAAAALATARPAAHPSEQRSGPQSEGDGSSFGGGGAGGGY